MKYVTALFIFAFMSVSVAQAGPEEDIKKNFAQRFPQVEIKSVDPTPVENIYQVAMSSGELLYVSADSKYLFSGDLMRMESTGVVNISEQWRSEKRVDSLNALKDKDLVVYQAEGEEKGEVLVFTDTSCGYCRKFHTEIPKLVESGVTVKYVAWPRYGLTSPAGQTMVNVWCSEDRTKAMNQAKANKSVAAPDGKTCDQHELQNQINLGQSIGVKGTPAIYLLDGRQVGGYVKADKLIQQMGLN